MFSDASLCSTECANQQQHEIQNAHYIHSYLLMLAISVNVNHFK